MTLLGSIRAMTGRRIHFPTLAGTKQGQVLSKGTSWRSRDSEGALYIDRPTTALAGASGLRCYCRGDDCVFLISASCGTPDETRLGTRSAAQAHEGLVRYSLADQGTTAADAAPKTNGS